MRKIIKKLSEWLSESSRDKHLGYGALCTILILLLSVFILTLQLSVTLTSSIFTLMVVGSLATGMEFKDNMGIDKFNILYLIPIIIISIIGLIIINLI